MNPNKVRKEDKQNIELAMASLNSYLRKFPRIKYELCPITITLLQTGAAITNDNYDEVVDGFLLHSFFTYIIDDKLEFIAYITGNKRVNQ